MFLFSLLFFFAVPCLLFWSLPSFVGTAGSSGSSSATASKEGNILNFVEPKMTESRRQLADDRFVLWCCINLRPQQMRFDEGFKLFAGILCPDYVSTTMSKETFDKKLDALYDKVKANVLDELRSVRGDCLAMGYSGPFLGAQLDLTTVANEEYITFSVSFVKKGSTDITRVALTTRAFPGSHTATDIKTWVEAVSGVDDSSLTFIFYFLFFICSCFPLFPFFLFRTSPFEIRISNFIFQISMFQYFIFSTLSTVCYMINHSKRSRSSCFILFFDASQYAARRRTFRKLHGGVR